jgi:uncharacterized repeat protein (TIGR03803 family)
MKTNVVPSKWLSFPVVAFFLGVLTVQSVAAADAYRLIHAFTGGVKDGSEPLVGSSLIASGSQLYGVTALGGSKGGGVLFTVTSAGAGFRLVHDFVGYSVVTDAGGSKTDGAYPTATPILVGSTLYGTTQQGGSNGFGCVYKVNTDGSGFQILHDFGANGEGSLPYGSVVAVGSTLFGLTSDGGTGFSQGTIFSVGMDGSNYQLLHSFVPGNNDGDDPEGSLLVVGSTLYGMTAKTIFQINSDGTGYQLLHSFTGTTTDGDNAVGSLVISGQSLYGLTSGGGANSVGTVFEFNPGTKEFHLLHSFATSEAWAPVGSAAISGSTLYGMTHDGHASSIGNGTVFQINTDGGGYQTIHTFAFPLTISDGMFPYGTPLVVGSSLFGMTTLGGSTHDKGCVFALTLEGVSGGGTPPKSAPPTLVVTSPKPNAVVTTPLITMTGTTADNVAVTNVTVLLNDVSIPVVTENAFKSWTASSPVGVHPGANVVVVTAENANGQVSATKTVHFVFKLLSKLAGTINGRGAVVPNDLGRTLNDGQSYTLTAVPAAGYAFSSWVRSEGIVATTSTVPKLTFTMEPNTTVTVNFVDIQKPTVKITTPAGAGSNSVVLITGTAKDNGSVASVWVQNGANGWNLAGTQNGFTNWTAGVILGPGLNTVQAYAVDAAGNRSSTNTVTLRDTATGFAPESILGTTISYASSNETGMASFGASTFSQWAGKGADAGVGVYTYTVTSPNSAQLALDFTAPPTQTSNNVGNVINLSFTDGTSGTFTNVGGDSGTFTLRDASITVPASFSGVTLQGYGFTDVFGDGNFTETFVIDPAGTYTFARYSPNAAMITEILTTAEDLGTTNYLMVNFLGDSNVYDRVSINAADAVSTSVGAFTVTNSEATQAYVAPESLAGFSGAGTQVSASGKRTSFTVSFTAGSYGKFSVNTNDDSGVGEYSFTRTGLKTALFLNTLTAPPSEANNGGREPIPFYFINGRTANFTNSDGHGTVTFSLPTPTVPLSLIGRTLTGSTKGGSGAFTFGEGAFVGSGGEKGATGNYAYSIYGPQEAMAVMTFTDATDAGKNAYLSLWFTTAKSGSFRQDDGAGNISVGTFTMK